MHGTVQKRTAWKADVAELARAGAPVLAGCAGLLYPARSLDHHPMCLVLEIDAGMTGALTLGYRDAVTVEDSPLARAGTRAHGHEFHRTAIRAAVAETPARAANAWRWQARDAVVTEGFIRGGVHASYLHTHWKAWPAPPAASLPRRPGIALGRGTGRALLRLRSPWRRAAP